MNVEFISNAASMTSCNRKVRLWLEDYEIMIMKIMIIRLWLWSPSCYLLVLYYIIEHCMGGAKYVKYAPLVQSGNYD